MEVLLLLLKKTVGVGVIGTIGMAGLGVTKDVVDTAKNSLLISATQIEMSECQKVLTSFYIRDNRFTHPEMNCGVGSGRTILRIKSQN